MTLGRGWMGYLVYPLALAAGSFWGLLSDRERSGLLWLNPGLGWVAPVVDHFRFDLGELIIDTGMRQGDSWVALDLPDDPGVRANVRAASDSLYLILLPGETYSFNELIGPRTAERGFRPATTLFMGVEVQEYGGGICMVSSALYAALMLGGYEVIERHAHTRPREYLPLGLDSAINWDDLDLKFRNNRMLAVGLVVRYFGTYFQVELRSDEPSPAVDTEWRNERVLPFETVERPSPFVTKRKAHRAGEPGVSGDRIWRYDGSSRIVSVRSVYRSVPEVLLAPEKVKAAEPWSE